MVTGKNQAAKSSIAMISEPLENVTPEITFGNWFLPSRRRQVFSAVLGASVYAQAESKNTIKLLVSFENSLGPLEFEAIKVSLENLLGGSVELLTRHALPSSLKDKLLEEAVVVF